LIEASKFKDEKANIRQIFNIPEMGRKLFGLKCPNAVPIPAEILHIFGYYVDTFTIRFLEFALCAPIGFADPMQGIHGLQYWIRI
jgi:hypothetical protein